MRPHNDKIILIVDDDPANLQILFQTLKQADYRVVPAQDARSAITRLNYFQPDLILLDIMMPGADGFELYQQLRNHPVTAETPVIFISALSEAVYKVKAFEMGGVDYITKPFQIEEVLARVETHLALRDARQNLQQNNVRLQQEITERKRTEEMLRKLFRAVEQSANTITITDLAGRVEFINPAFSRITGYSSQEVVGKNTNILKSGKMPVELYKELWDTIKRGQVWQGEILNKRKNGELYWELATISPIKDDAGHTTHYVAIKEDITQRKQAEQEAQEARDKLARRVDALSSLNFIMQTMATVTDLQPALEIIAGTMTRIFSARSTGIALLNKARTELTVTTYFSSSGLEPTALGAIIPVANNPSSSQVIETKKSMVISQAQTNPLTAPIHNLLQTRQTECLMITPLLSRGEVIGTIGVDTGQPDRFFTPDEVNLAEMISAQVAGTIESIRLFTKIQESNQRMQDELALAREMQQGLLPPARPDWPRLDLAAYTQPAYEVGGDFYAYRAGDDHTFEVEVGDVSGKGVSAALLMAVSISQLNAFLPPQMTRIGRMAYLDKAIEPYAKPRGQNCALCYVNLELNPKGLENASAFAALHIVNAGGIPPYIKRANGDVDWPEVYGFALGQGLGAEIGYRQVTVNLAKGDIIILTSDGVAEARDEAGDILGFDRLEEIIRVGPTTGAETMLKFMKQEIVSFTKGAEWQDDVTIVVLQLRDDTTA